MQAIKVHKVKEEIEYYTKHMGIYSATKNLNYILENKCINCKEKCSDCYLSYKEKIALEKILKYIKKNKIKIKGAKTL